MSSLARQLSFHLTALWAAGIDWVPFAGIRYIGIVHVLSGVTPMAEPTLQELASRLTAVEAVVGLIPPAAGKSWRTAIGTFTDPEFHANVIAEAEAIRDADREAGRRGDEE